MKAATSRSQQLLIRGLFPALIVFLGGYAASGQRTTAVPKGDWGGNEVAVSVTDAGASIQLDCANLSITKQLRVKKDGSFVAEGIFTRNGPGPIRIDAQGSPVTIKGKVAAKTMTFHVSDAKTGEAIGDFTVAQGRSSRLHRCY